MFGKSVAKLLCLIAILSVVMCGCSADKNINETDEDNSVKNESAMTERIELSEPQSLNVYYDSNTKTVKLYWASVIDANKYEIDCGNTSMITTSDTSYESRKFEEGHIYKIKVRAVREEGNHVDYSDWLEKEYEVPVNLSTPDNIQKDLDGSCLHLCWDETEGATGYEIKSGSLSEKVTKAGYDFYGLNMGESYSLVIRALKEVEDRVYHSDWAKVSYTVSVVNYSDIDYDEAVLLDYDHLLEWAKKKGYNQSISTMDLEGEQVTVVDISHKDEKYEGALGWIREKGAKFEAGLESAYDSMISSEIEKLESDFSSKLKGIYSIGTSGGIRKYIKELDEEAKNAGNWGFIEGILNAFKNDTDKHYIYYYDNRAEGAVFSVNVFVDHIGENHETAKYNKSSGYTKDNDGFYNKTSKTTGQDYKILVEKTEINGMNYWYINVYNSRMR